MTDCPFCGDELMSFVEELEDGSRFYLVICPTCYKYHESEPLKQSNQIQSAKGRLHGRGPMRNEWAGEPVEYLQQIGVHDLKSSTLSLSGYSLSLYSIMKRSKHNPSLEFLWSCSAPATRGLRLEHGGVSNMKYLVKIVQC